MESNQISYTLSELTEILSGDLHNGLPETKVFRLSPVESSSEGDVSFLVSAKHIAKLDSCNASVLLIKPEILKSYNGAAIVVDDPYLAYAKLSKLFDPRSPLDSGIHSSATFASSANISPKASIGAQCVIGENVSIGEGTEIYPGVCISDNTSIGDNCLVYSNVSIYSGVTIGHNAIIHSNSVIGADGFGFAPTGSGWQKIHQLGGVEIGDNVEIGASVTIDRGALEDTVIQSNVIIDNQVHIAHNCDIGEGTAIAACSGIAGSTRLGERCIVAGMVGIVGHLDIASGTQFHAGTLVTKSIKGRGIYASTPPMQEIKEWQKNSVRIKQLDKLATKVKNLEKRIDES